MAAKLSGRAQIAGMELGVPALLQMEQAGHRLVGYAARKFRS